MILREHVEHHGRLSDLGAFTGDMLLLGNHKCRMLGHADAKSFFKRLGAAHVETLDLDGGDLALDLNKDLDQLSRRYDSVYNLGTVEHVWNAHQAWVNTLRAVKVGGMLASHSPVSGYRNHGIHVTSAWAIVDFVALNGFEIAEHWMSEESYGETLWLAARKREHVMDYRMPEQVYRHGRKPSPSPASGGEAGAA